MFTLVSEKDENQVFAWGIEIYDGDNVEAVIYRRDRARRAMFGVHASAEAAKNRFSQLYAPMVVNWEDDFECDISEPSRPDDQVEAAELAHPRP
jgi:hypothetical protein